MELTNAEIKLIKKLKDKKYRKSENLFLVEGKKAVDELLKSNFEIKYTISSSPNNYNYPNFCQVDYAILKSIATTETPQDIVCVVAIPSNINELPKGNSLVLDNLQDPGNVGTLIRTAVAFNFKDIYLIDCADVFSEKVIRASMGAIFKAHLHIVDFEFVKNNKLSICDKLIGTDMSSTSLKDIACKGKTALVIGNEGNGVSKELLDLCDYKVTIPMANSVESLNAGVAGSILMYEIFNR